MKEFKNLSGHFLIKISLKLIQPIHQLSGPAYLDKADDSSHSIKGMKEHIAEAGRKQHKACKQIVLLKGK